MRTYTVILIAFFGFLSSGAFATFVPVTDEILETGLHSRGTAAHYSDGYLQINKSRGTISLYLQPNQAACGGDSCAAESLFMDELTVEVDDCGSIRYHADQKGDRLLRVTVIDNSQYDAQRCPSYLPVSPTDLQVGQTISSDLGERIQEDALVGNALSAIRY